MRITLIIISKAYQFEQTVALENMHKYTSTHTHKIIILITHKQKLMTLEIVGTGMFLEIFH